MENKRKKSKKIEETCDEQEDETNKKKLKKFENCNNFELPVEILLKIFGYLPLKDLCKAASVCKNWRKIAHDETLWYHMDLSKLDVDLRRLWKLFRQAYACKAKSIEIHTSHRKQTRGEMDRMLTPAFMNKLNDTCKNLTIIKLKYVDLTVINVNDLPKQITELNLMRCEIPLNWFDKNNLNNLQVLDLTKSSRVCARHLNDISNCVDSLNTLILSSCYRVDDKAIQIITTKFINLVSLKIDGTNCTDLGLHWICNRLKKLELLNIKIVNI